MPKAGPEQFRSIEEYRTAAAAFYGVCGLILLAFENYNLDLKNFIIRNFVARTAVMVRGVMKLWDLKDFQDCWILYRSMLDRLFHLVDIDDNNRYESFENWSFYKQYKFYHVMRSDPQLPDAANGQIPPTAHSKARYDKLSKAPPKWKRPKAEDVAKSLDLSFLYKYGYDPASTHVHPMANDGLQDFYSITNLEPPRPFSDQRPVLHNSILVGCHIVQESLSRCDFQWHRVIKPFFPSLMSHLKDGSAESMDAFLTAVQTMASETNLCRPKSESEKE